SEIKYYGKCDMASDVTSALKKVKKSGLKLATASPNAYAAAVSDYIDCVPTVSSNLSCLDVDIPFYGMVFSGCKENAVAINLSSEPQKSFLNSLKTGSGLSFFISYDLGDAPVEKNGLYISSGFAINKNLISEYIDGSKDFISAVSGVSVEKYEVLDTDFSKTVFQNGTVLYVNESAEEKSADGVTVKAMDYQWR
ncbi:MAG: hypothetical protein J5662_06465, partial [Clostridia bacterium]|nr:hypothetical protein [Clostridia bacterium]